MPKAAAGSIAGRALIVALAVILAFQVVRTAAVSLPFDRRPQIAARWWPSHPAILADRTMAAIGTAAARGQAPSAPTLALVDELATRAPLSATPFLIDGAVDQSRGRQAAAERLFTEARARDPRSRAARYFLADRYFRTNRIAPGLIEMAALTRLEPLAAAPFVPALVAYAQSPGAVAELRNFFRAKPEVEPAVLLALANDARNADLVLALATAGTRASPAPEWQGRLVGRLVDSGQYQKAHAIWVRLSGAGEGGGLFNPGFEAVPAPPPFNWAYPATSDGLAEPADGGTLQVLYYGRQRAVLASQLLILPPGRYRLSMDASGTAEASGLQWTLRCAGLGEGFFKLPFRSRPALRGSFIVPPGGCPAQWLELVGVPGDFPRTDEMTIGKLRLDREAAP